MSIIFRCTKCSGVLEDVAGPGPSPRAHWCPNCNKSVDAFPYTAPSPLWDAEWGCLKPFTVTIDPSKGWPPEITFHPL